MENIENNKLPFMFPLANYTSGILYGFCYFKTDTVYSVDEKGNKTGSLQYVKFKVPGSKLSEFENILKIVTSEVVLESCLHEL